MTTDVTEVREEVMGGPALRVCPRCLGLHARKFCGQCGEKLEWNGEHWGALRIDVASRSGVARQESWKVYPGQWEAASGGVRLWIDGPEQLAWVRDRLQRGNLERYCSLEGPSGQRIPPDDPVFHCAIRVLDSQIRGCMTQRFRTPACGEESTLLPLSEPQRTFSLCDLLDHEGNHAAAQRLLAGVLWERSARKERVYCPLFGRALRLAPRDSEELPGRMTDLANARREGPLVLPVRGAAFRRGAALVVPDPEFEGQRYHLPGSGLPAWVVPTRSGRVAVGSAGTGLGSLVGPGANGKLVVPAGARVHRTLGALVVQYANPQGLWVTALATNPDAPLSDAVHLAPGVADVDARGERSVALILARGRLTLVWVTRGAKKPVAVWGYSVGALPSTGWRVQILSETAVGAWNVSGASLLLKQEGGWALSPVASTTARLRDPKPNQVDIAGVVGAVPGSQGEWVLLSSLGHRLTKLGLDRTVKWPDPPVRIVQDVVLPFSARRLSGGSGRNLYLDDLFGGFKVSSHMLEPESYLPGTPEAQVMALDGGGFVVRRPEQLEVLYGPVATQESWFVESMAENTVRPPAVAEYKGVFDRFGYLPHKVTWGG